MHNTIDLSAAERESLKEILQCKIQGLQGHDRLLVRTMALDEIINLSFARYPLSNEPDVHVELGDTFAGVLFYRGQVVESIREGVGLQYWSVQEILSFFCSNIYKHFSFSKYFRETRDGLLFCITERIHGRSTRLQNTCMLACMQYEEKGALYNPLEPTQHMLAFAKLIQHNAHEYYIAGYDENQRLRVELQQQIALARKHKDWAKLLARTREICDFIISPSSETQPTVSTQP
ncbi:hypothetical protein E8E11_000564 [Didymella keratinophila]|nr:hypothetical protein E8E11_000564 [Didymella keratinophila]